MKRLPGSLTVWLSDDAGAVLTDDSDAPLTLDPAPFGPALSTSRAGPRRRTKAVVT